MFKSPLITNTYKNIVLALLFTSLFCTSCSKDDPIETIEPSPKMEQEDKSRREVFTFMSNGVSIKGKIYIPGAHASNKDLPVVFLIDYQEQHNEIIYDEFNYLVNIVHGSPDLDALVVSLNEHPNISAGVDNFDENFQVFKDLATHVDNTYTKSTSRTFIGRGSEAGVVMMAMLSEEQDMAIFNNFIATDPDAGTSSFVQNMLKSERYPENIENKKMHFSYTIEAYDCLCKEFIELLETQNYPWLEFGIKVYTADSYVNTYKNSYVEGIKYIFDQ